MQGEVPKAVQLSAFPWHITSELPALKDYWYAHLDRAIVLVDGLSLTVAAVVPLPEQLHATKLPTAQQAALNWAGGLGGISKEQKQEIYRALWSAAETTGSSTLNSGVQSVPDGVAIRAGVELPSDVRLTPLSESIASKFQDLSGHGFAKLQDGRVVLADPHRRVVGVITQAESGSDENSGSRDPMRNLEEKQNHPSAYTGPGTKR